jgi:hypothetical protein
MKIPHRTATLANLNHWRQGQGAKIKANRPIEVYRACDHRAQLVAAIRDPLILSADEIKLCVQSAISHERSRQFGAIAGMSADTWWEQISGIAARWGIETSRAEWTTETKSHSATAEAA